MFAKMVYCRILISTQMKKIFTAEIVGQERSFRDSERRILRESSPIEGPLRPAIVAVGDIATYATYGISVVARALFQSRPQDKPEKATQRNAWLG